MWFMWMNKIFLVNFPSLNEINFHRYFTFLQICGMHNPVKNNTFNLKPFCSGYTISFNIEIIKKKFPDAFFIHFQTSSELLYKQIIFCRETGLINNFIIDDFKEYLDLNINNFSLEDLDKKNLDYNNMINDLFKNNSNFINLGLINSFRSFIFNEKNLNDFFYIHGFNTEININKLKSSIKTNEVKFLDYLDFNSQDLHIPNIYTINSLISDFIFKVPFDLNHCPSYYKNLKTEIENAY